MRERYRSIRRSIALLALSALAVACGSSSNDASPTATAMKEPAPLSVCTADIEGTNGHACATEGMDCDFVFACHSVTQLARCTCEGGRFACTDSTGEVAPGSAPQCVKNAPPSAQECPQTMADASGTSCDTLGRACFYEGALCPEAPLSIHHFDYCQCTRGPSGDMTYVCKRALCSPILQR